MNQGTKNIEKQLCFADENIEAKWINNIENFYIPTKSIVFNLSNRNAYIEDGLEQCLLPRTSAIFSNVMLKKADSIILVRVKNTITLEKISSSPNWRLAEDISLESKHDSSLGQLKIKKTIYPNTISLWYSSQAILETQQLDPLFVSNQSKMELNKSNFLVKVNLWFAPSHTDCSIHREHNFMEIHTQISGNGQIQKFLSNQIQSLYQTIMMPEGYTHQSFFRVLDDGSFLYPWHQYYADTDCLWMAIEFHPESDKTTQI
jgi:hypothetical protein